MAVERALETVRPLVDERGHRIDLSLPPVPILLDADPTRLEQVLSNLLSNAAKYTPGPGTIQLSAAREGAMAVVRVRDSGIGIRPEMLDRVFDLFRQADRLPERVPEGLGIGLTLVRSLVEMHGGSVAAASEGLGCGAEFVVRLPCLPATESPRAPARRGRPAARSRRVLVVDDNVDSAESLVTLLEIGGHRAWMAHDGPSALLAAREHRPELVLLDIGLPAGMDGYEVARRMRSEAGPAGVRIVALTGYGQEDDRRRAAEAGFDQHLVKPVDLPRLWQLLREP